MNTKQLITTEELVELLLDEEPNAARILDSAFEIQAEFGGEWLYIGEVANDAEAKVALRAYLNGGTK